MFSVQPCFSCSSVICNQKWKLLFPEWELRECCQWGCSKRLVWTRHSFRGEGTRIWGSNSTSDIQSERSELLACSSLSFFSVWNLLGVYQSRGCWRARIDAEVSAACSEEHLRSSQLCSGQFSSGQRQDTSDRLFRSQSWVKANIIHDDDRDSLQREEKMFISIFNILSRTENEKGTIPDIPTFLCFQEKLFCGRVLFLRFTAMVFRRVEVVPQQMISLHFHKSQSCG